MRCCATSYTVCAFIMLAKQLHCLLSVSFDMYKYALLCWLTIHSLLVRCDGRALDAHVVLLYTPPPPAPPPRPIESAQRETSTRHEQSTFRYRTTVDVQSCPARGRHQHELEETTIPTKQKIHHRAGKGGGVLPKLYCCCGN